MSSEAEKRERAARGPHKESVDVYGVDPAGDQEHLPIPLPIQPAPGVVFDVSDRCIRELGKVGLSLCVEYDITGTTRDAAGRLTQIIMTDGVFIKTIDIVRDANGRILTKNETVV